MAPPRPPKGPRQPLPAGDTHRCETPKDLTLEIRVRGTTKGNRTEGKIDYVEKILLYSVGLEAVGNHGSCCRAISHEGADLESGTLESVNGGSDEGRDIDKFRECPIQAGQHLEWLEAYMHLKNRDRYRPICHNYRSWRRSKHGPES